MVIFAEILSMVRGLRDTAGLEKNAPPATMKMTISKTCFIRK
jgi:hypothetical protein